MKALMSGFALALVASSAAAQNIAEFELPAATLRLSQPAGYCQLDRVKDAEGFKMMASLIEHQVLAAWLECPYLEAFRARTVETEPKRYFILMGLLSSNGKMEADTGTSRADALKQIAISLGENGEMDADAKAVIEREKQMARDTLNLDLNLVGKPKVIRDNLAVYSTSLVSGPDANGEMSITAVASGFSLIEGYYVVISNYQTDAGAEALASGADQVEALLSSMDELSRPKPAQ